MHSQINNLTSQLNKTKDEFRTLNSFRSITRCASNEGEMCQCKGAVFYGEKFSGTGGQQMTFAQMIQFPFLEAQSLKPLDKITCSSNFFIQGDNQEAWSALSDGKPKQCFCEVD